MSRLVGEQAESLFDEALPVEVRELPEDLDANEVRVVDEQRPTGLRRGLLEGEHDFGPHRYGALPPRCGTLGQREVDKSRPSTYC